MFLIDGRDGVISLVSMEVLKASMPTTTTTRRRLSVWVCERERERERLYGRMWGCECSERAVSVTCVLCARV